MQGANENWGQPRACDLKRQPARARLPYDACLILVEGLLTRERILANGRRQIVAVHVPGDVCNLTAVSNGYVDHDMVALSPVAYFPVPHHWLSALARGSADLSQALWRAMSREAAISAAWIVNLGQRPAYQRIAHFICELEARLHAAGYDGGGRFDWPGTQTDIGAAMGLSLVHVNKTLRKLETDRLMSTGRHIKFHDVAKLRTVVGFDPSYLAREHESLADMLLARIGAPAEALGETMMSSRDGLGRNPEAAIRRVVRPLSDHAG